MTAPVLNAGEIEANKASIPKLLRAIANGTYARENRHDIIFNTAADLIEELDARPAANNRRAEAAEARIAKLTGALAPFAAAAVEDDGSERVEWRHHADDELVESSEALVELTAGEFRRARAALSDQQSDPARPPYSEGDVVGPCVCGSWPGGPCLRCKWRPAKSPLHGPTIEACAKVAKEEAEVLLRQLETIPKTKRDHWRQGRAAGASRVASAIRQLGGENGN